MNYKEACKVLELTDEIITNEMIKQQYRKLALKYHPDKNKTADTSHFVNIQNAYEYLMKHNQRYTDGFFTSYEGNEEPPINENSDYKTLLFSFLKDILLNRENMENIKEKWIYMILLKITNIGSNHLLEFLNIVSVDILIKIYDIINTYREVLHIPEEIIAKIGEILEAKLEKDECIVLNPFIEDLMENNLYKLTEGSQKFIIPLWHHELIYDISGRDLYVRFVVLARWLDRCAVQSEDCRFYSKRQAFALVARAREAFLNLRNRNSHLPTNKTVSLTGPPRGPTPLATSVCERIFFHFCLTTV